MDGLVKIPITVFTGYLGAGKTTIILEVVKQISDKYKIVYLKNEFGSAGVDSLLLKETNIQVKEMVNGCLCCVLIGKIENALNEILEKYHPDRIIIETNGSASPAPIALEIKKLDDFYLDGIINVVDCLNFETSIARDPIVKLQAGYTDIVLLNKAEGITGAEKEKIIDTLYEISPSIPIVQTTKGFVDANVVFGIDSKLSEMRVISNSISRVHEDYEVSDIEVQGKISQDIFDSMVKAIDESDIWRAKGIIPMTDGQDVIFNYVNGKSSVLMCNRDIEQMNKKMLTLIGKNTSFYSGKISTLLHESID